MNKIIALISTLVTCCIAKNPEPKTAQITFEQATFEGMRTFAEILQYVDQKHPKIINPQQAMYGAFEGFLGTLDAHSSFLDEKTCKTLFESTSGVITGGIGVIIDNTRQAKDKFLLLVDTVPDGPADKAGVKPLDKIIEIDGMSLEGMTTDEATSKLKGERGTKVHIKCMRENHPDIIEFEIVRDEIKEQSSLCFYLPDQQIYYLSLTMFSDNAVQQLASLLQKINKNGYKGLILDLRNNSGGLLTAAIDIAGFFLDKNSLVVSTKGKGDKEIEKYATTRAPIANTAIPIFILINNYTASAAEILAGCLRTHSDMLSKKAGKKEQKKLMVFLVGTQTFGKGSVQEVIPIGNNCAIKLTTALYYLPENCCIQGTGIVPDFVVEKKLPLTDQMVWFNKYYGSEKALTNSIKVDEHETKKQEEESKKKESTSKKEKNWTERAKEVLDKDNQFRETITLINIFHTAAATTPEQVKTRQNAVNYLKKIYVAQEPLTFEEVKI